MSDNGQISHEQKAPTSFPPIQQHISRLLGGEKPATPTGVATSMTPHSLHSAKAQGHNPIVPICDIAQDGGYSRIEVESRCKLAALYRLVDLFQWSQGIFNHITVNG